MTSQKQSKMIQNVLQKNFDRKNGCQTIDDKTCLKIDFKQLLGKKFYAAKWSLSVTN
jgi:hypothetical protein